MLKSLKNYLLKDVYRHNKISGAKLDELKVLAAKSLIDQNKLKTDLHDTEFKVFSQWGDDGIIQYLINKIQIDTEVFIEFGTEDYLESNTRFLLINNNWSGLVMDGAIENIEFIKQDYIYWKYELLAKHAFVTEDNINELIITSGLAGNIGLLNIDIDGNDYWVWKALDCVEPDIVIIEYNNVFGIERAITVPYDPNFVRGQAHFSGLFAGASLLALCDLAETKGYYFIGSNSAGNNAYFVRKHKADKLKILNPKEGYVKSKFRESRDKYGNLDFITREEQLKRLKGLEVFNTRTKKIEEF